MSEDKKPDTIFQKLYDKIKNTPTPAWLKEAGDRLHSTCIVLTQEVLIPALEEVGEAGAILIADAIETQAKDTTKTGAEKMQSVFSVAKEYLSHVPDSILNFVINGLYLKFKQSNG